MRNKGSLRTFDLGDVSSSSLLPFRLFCLRIDFSVPASEQIERN